MRVHYEIFTCSDSNLFMKKSVFIISTFVAVVIASFAFKKPETLRYENLKVLPKNTTKQQMDSVMKHFSASLGVRCTYCHVRGNDAQMNFDFASDANHKKAEARDMMRMMNKINKKYFHGGNESGQAITCYSCHHGQEEPATKPPVPAPRERQSASPSSDTSK